MVIYKKKEIDNKGSSKQSKVSLTISDKNGDYIIEKINLFFLNFFYS